MHLPSLSGVPAQWPLDYLIIAVLIVLIALECMRAGSARATALALALPLAYTLFQAISHAVLLEHAASQLQSATIESALFGALAFASYFLVYRVIGFFGDGGSLVQSVLLGIALTILILVFWFQVPALSSIWHFGPTLEGAFAEGYRFWWMVGAYVIFAAMRS